MTLDEIRNHIAHIEEMLTEIENKIQKISEE